MGSQLFEHELKMRDLEAQYFMYLETRRGMRTKGLVCIVMGLVAISCFGCAALLNFLKNREILGLCLCFLGGYEVSVVVRTIRLLREDVRTFRELERSYEACEAALELAKKKENRSNDRT